MLSTYNKLHVLHTKCIESKFVFTEDWTGAINYYRNLPFTRLNTDSFEQICVHTLLLTGNMDRSTCNDRKYCTRF